MAGERVAIIGSGNWGTTLALVAARAGRQVSLLVTDPFEAERVARTRVNGRFLPAFELPASVQVSPEFAHVVQAATLIVLAVPSQHMRRNSRQLAPWVGDAVVVSAAKGLERETLLRMTDVIKAELPAPAATRVVALSGPNLATEIAAGKPATSVVAGTDRAAAELARDLLHSPLFRTYTNDDVIGVEIAGALKNVIAIGAGIADGLGAGENAKAAFITRGLVEIARLGISLGANPLTFAGLAGLGDLIATCASQHSRNRHLGQELARGRPLAEIQATMRGVAEGVFTTEAACALANRARIDLPIASEVHNVLFAGKSPVAAVADLMQRDAKDELDVVRGAVPYAPGSTMKA